VGDGKNSNAYRILVAKCAVKLLTGRRRKEVRITLRWILEIQVVRTGDDGTDEDHVAWQTTVLAVCSLRVLLRP